MSLVRRATTVGLALALPGAAAGGSTCPVPLSDFAESAVQSLENRYCEEAQEGFTHENAPVTDPVQREQDTIWTLLAFALVAVEWDPGRGHQVGAVIVDEITDEALWVDFNRNVADNSPVAHAETRAILDYVQAANDAGTSEPYWALLDDTAVYTTLEPCQMCAGTINMARVRRVVFGMEDRGFGDALDYLHVYPFHANFEFHDGTRTAQALIDEVAAHPGSSVTSVILGARYAFDYAVLDLEAFQVAHPANQPVLDAALTLLNQHASGPPEVPGGAPGEPLTAGRVDSGGSAIELHWDTQGCGTTDYHLLHGLLADVRDLAPTGAACGLDLDGTHVWTGVPAQSLWFLVVSSDAAGNEGSWGTDSSGAERNHGTPSGACGTSACDNSGDCP
jgi:tRNA(Arg) A34 adenosine deaminase TadA